MTARTLIALQMPYTDAQGDVHPASVWIPAAVTENIVGEQGGIPIDGFSSAVTLQAHDQPCGQHDTQIGRAAFDAGSQETVEQIAAALGMPTTAITEAQNTAYLALSLALATQDTPVLDASGKSLLNPDGTPQMRSFFQGSQVVTVTVPDGAP